MQELPLTLERSAHFTATRNACAVCTPLGACLVFRGIERALPLLHGSQGCSTYIRRYLIEHYREPIDIASSNFSESAAVHGGGEVFRTALTNVLRQYEPALVGIATTCLSETIGDDVRRYLREFRKEHEGQPLPALVHVSTPSYRGTHADGFHAAVHAVAAALAEGGEPLEHVNVLPGMVSPADLRHLRDILAGFGLRGILLPDYADPLDGPCWEGYVRLPAGGTPVEELRLLGRARATFEFGATLPATGTAAALLESRFGVPRQALGLPIGIRATDRFLERLAACAGRPVPARYQAERGRLIDAYVDGHKYLSGKRAVVYGEEDLVAALAGFLSEIGVRPILCGSGGRSGRLAEVLAGLGPVAAAAEVRQGVDFLELEEALAGQVPDLLIGSSKGYALARKLGVPLVRVGFPIHDRLGAGRLLHLGYRGTQELFDRLVNTVIAAHQDGDPNGYMNM
jgi:nitrogenase molybdenum-iron protein NifN